MAPGEHNQTILVGAILSMCQWGPCPPKVSIDVHLAPNAEAEQTSRNPGGRPMARVARISVVGRISNGHVDRTEDHMSKRGDNRSPLVGIPVGILRLIAPNRTLTVNLALSHNNWPRQTSGNPTLSFAK